MDYIRTDVDHIAARFARHDARTIGLTELLQLIRRRAVVIATIIVASTVLTALIVLSMQKLYTAHATLVLERTDIRPFEIEPDLKQQARDRSATETEMDVLTSRQFAGRIVDQMNLVDNPYFNTYLPDEALASDPLTLFFARTAKALSDLLPMDTRRALGLRPPAAKILPPIHRQRDRAVSTFLSHMSVDRKGESLAVTVAVSNIDPGLAAEIANNIANLYVATSLELKQDVRKEDRDRAQATGGAVAFLRDRTAQPLLGTLRAEEARLLRERADLGANYGPSHPDMVKNEAEVLSVRKMISEEVERILLDLEVEAAKPSARVISLAETPTEQSYPTPKLAIAGAFVGSTVLAIILALILEAADTRIRSSDRTVQLLNLPNLAYVPRPPKRIWGKFRNAMDFILKRPRSSFTEAMRSLYLASRMSPHDRLHQVFMFTSSLPGEGKTTVALGFATIAAADRRNTVLVDLDLHRSEMSRALDLRGRNFGLEKFFGGECTLAEAIHRVGSIDVLAPSQGTSEPSALLNSTQLVSLLDQLRSAYEVVVIDTPPVLIVETANWLSPLVDNIIVVVGWAKTKEDALWEAVSNLRMNHGPLTGTVINGVDSKIQAKHGYGGTPRYYREARSYNMD